MATRTTDPKTPDLPPTDGGLDDGAPSEGAPDPVDHDREPGVPPETNDDYEDELDHEGADSFPASDPPGSY